MNDRALARIRADLDALARRRRQRFAGALLACLGASLAMGFGSGVAPFPGSPMLFGVLLATLCVLAGLSLALAFGLMFPAPRTVRVLVIGLVAAGLAAIVGMAGEARAGPHPGAGCLTEGTEFTFASLLLMLVLGRGGVLRRHGPVGTWLGLGAALAVVPMLQLACPDRSVEHLLLWHGGVLAVGVALAGLLRRLIPQSADPADPADPSPPSGAPP